MRNNFLIFFALFVASSSHATILELIEYTHTESDSVINGSGGAGEPGEAIERASIRGANAVIGSAEMECKLRKGTIKASCLSQPDCEHSDRQIKGLHSYRVWAHCTVTYRAICDVPKAKSSWTFGLFSSSNTITDFDGETCISIDDINKDADVESKVRDAQTKAYGLLKQLYELRTAFVARDNAETATETCNVNHLSGFEGDKEENRAKLIEEAKADIAPDDFQRLALVDRMYGLPRLDNEIARLELATRLTAKNALDPEFNAELAELMKKEIKNHFNEVDLIQRFTRDHLANGITTLYETAFEHYMEIKFRDRFMLRAVNQNQKTVDAYFRIKALEAHDLEERLKQEFPYEIPAYTDVLKAMRGRTNIE